MGDSEGSPQLEIVGDGHLPFAVSVETAAELRLEMRADVDGSIEELSFGPEMVDAGGTWLPAVSAADFSIPQDLQFSAMIEGKLHVSRGESTRVMPLSPVFLHPTDAGGVLLYTAELHETVFAGGDYRGILPTAVAGGEVPEPIAHVSVARVRVLPIGEDPAPE